MRHAQTEDESWFRILYWGPSGAGKTETLRALRAKLNANQCGELQSIPTRLDPTLTYEQFSIAIGKLGGRDTQLLLIAVPGDPEAAQTRKQLLDQVDGIVLVCDPSRDSPVAHLEALQELRESLSAYGRTLEEIPVAIQYNKRDLADSLQIEALHRQIRLPNAAVFETNAPQKQGVLEGLTAVSRRAIRTFSSGSPSPGEVEQEQNPLLDLMAQDPDPPSSSSDTELERDSVTALMEAAILADGEDAEDEDLDGLLHQAESQLDHDWATPDEPGKVAGSARISTDLKIVSVGTARPSGERAVCVPVVLGNDAGESVSLSLTIRLDPMLEDDGPSEP